jgi:hypothetical protein
MVFTKAIRMAQIAAVALALGAHVQAQSAAREPEKIITFTLELDRLAPKSMTVEAGEYLIMVRNSVFVDEVPLALDDERGARLSTSRVLAKRGSGKLRLRLEPGRYVVSSPISPKFRSELVVVPRKR